MSASSAVAEAGGTWSPPPSPERSRQAGLGEPWVSSGRRRRVNRARSGGGVPSELRPARNSLTSAVGTRLSGQLQQDARRLGQPGSPVVYGLLHGEGRREETDLGGQSEESQQADPAETDGGPPVERRVKPRDGFVVGSADSFTRRAGHWRRRPSLDDPGLAHQFLVLQLGGTLQRTVDIDHRHTQWCSGRAERCSAVLVGSGPDRSLNACLKEMPRSRIRCLISAAGRDRA